MSGTKRIVKVSALKGRFVTFEEGIGRILRKYTGFRRSSPEYWRAYDELEDFILQWCVETQECVSEELAQMKPPLRLVKR